MHAKAAGSATLVTARTASRSVLSVNAGFADAVVAALAEL
eukprot:COSAG06_NODE_55296_length_290_cov_0.811518_2_plen_39_part_01